ncbi:pseudouridine synthase [Bacteroidia bacterium]|nr:pseudouridine synthase [Bacteroidia bacterium]
MKTPAQNGRAPRPRTKRTDHIKRESDAPQSRETKPPYNKDAKPFRPRSSDRGDRNEGFDRQRTPAASGYKARPYEKKYEPRTGTRPSYNKEDKPFRPRSNDRSESFDRQRTPATSGYKARPYEKKYEPRTGTRPSYNKEDKPFRQRDNDQSEGFDKQRTPAASGYKARPYEKKYEPRTGAKPSYDRSAKPSYRDKNAFRPRAGSSSYARPVRRKPVLDAPSDAVRLNKFIANSGVCSRREADEYILNGEITVNGEVVTTLGTKISFNDEVKFHDQRLAGEKKVYILLNKPKGYITTSDDPHAKKTVMELVENACSERIYPVGRLDRETTGVLLFTNDGELTKELTHPSYSKQKIYHVFLNKNVSKEDVERLVSGIMLEDGETAADEASYVDEKNDCSQVGIEIHSGKNRVVRRMFEALGYEVKHLDRVYFAGLTKKSLERGKWRKLSPKEVNMLKMGAYE